MISWSDSALDDLRAIRAGLGPEAAARVGRIIAETVDALAGLPEAGRPGALAGTREIPLPGLPWRLALRASESGAVVLRVLG